MATIKNVDAAKVKLSPGKKICYALGDVGNNFSWSFVSSYLMNFWTDVFGISAGAAGSIMFLSRFWDAANDPLVGKWSDQTKSKWGSYRPWVLFGSLPLGIITVLTFTSFPIQSAGGRLAYGFITFFILVFVYTCVNVPYSAMQAALTLDSQERASVASFRLFFAFATSLLISNMTLRFVGWFGQGDRQRGFMFTAILYACIMFVLHMVCFKNTREVVETKVEKIPYRTAFKCLKGNWPVIILAFAFLTYGFFNYGRSAVALYYFTYNAGNEMIFATYALFNMGGSMLGTLLMPQISKRLKNKASVPMIGWSVGGILLIGMYFLNPTTQIPLLFVMQLFCSIGFGMSASMIYGMVPDTTEYTQLKYGLRASGFISAMVNFALKIGMAFGTAGVGWIMDACGYVPNQQQTPLVSNGINMMFTMVPGILALVAVLLLKFYKLDKNTYNQVVSDLQG